MVLSWCYGPKLPFFLQFILISVAQTSLSVHRPWLGAPQSTLSGLPVFKCSEGPVGSFNIFSLRKFLCTFFFLQIGTFCNALITLDLPMYPLDTPVDTPPLQGFECQRRLHSP